MIDSFKGDFDFLSNFYRCSIRFEGKRYSSVEHAFQAAKTTDNKIRKRILSATTPGKAKRLGRQVALRPGWDKIKDDVMMHLVMYKFVMHDALKVLLLDTGNERLIEGNHWHDNYWGICFCSECEVGLEGENRLGLILMTVRKKLK